MWNVLTDSRFCYKGAPVGQGVHGVIGGVGEKRAAAPTAKTPFYYKRISAEFYFRVSRGKQDKMLWPGTDPLGARLPAGKRTTLIAGVSAWQALSEAAKEVWRDLARAKGRWGGYQMFMSDYLKTH